MFKPLFSLLLAAAICITMIPNAALAAKTTSENEPVYLGTEAEYRTTFDAMFDENGLRVVAIGYNSNDGRLSEKVGLVDKYGNFVVQPIYDNIIDRSGDIAASDYKPAQPIYFLDGYAQAVRDGKMGLLNVKGEEVIPCKYDFVGMPSEGVCPLYVFKKKYGSNNEFYLGYWNLEKNKEIVAPNKYVTPFLDTALNNADDYGFYKKPSGDYFRIHDFNDGHALVFTESGYSDKLISDFRKSSIIDKNGKDILGKTYITGLSLLSSNDYQQYPQKGPYLCFYEMDVKPDQFKNYEVCKAWQKQEDIKRGSFKFGASAFSGLVGPKGVMIPATYTQSSYLDVQKAEVSFGFAYFQIIPDSKIIITTNAINPKLEYYAPAISNRYGVIDINNKKVIPFGEYVGYNDESKIFVSDGRIYDSKGKEISKRKYNLLSSFFTNGYNLTITLNGKYNHDYNSEIITWYSVKADGKEYNLTKALGLGKYEKEFAGKSDFNTRGYIWLQRQGKKWGLYDYKGKTIIKPTYDKVDYAVWSNGENGNAIVTKSGKSGIVSNAGKEIVPCKYDGFRDLGGNINKVDQEMRPSVIGMDGKDGTGVIDYMTGKIIIPAKYQSVEAYVSKKSKDAEYSIDVYHVRTGGKTLILDENGKEIFSTSENFREVSGGLNHYNDNSGYFDSKGHIIYPGSLDAVYNLEIFDSYTIYIKDKKVYRVSANYLEPDYKYKTYSPSSSKDKKEIETYANSQKEAHRKAHDEAVGNPYQQKIIYKEPFASFRTVVDKITYKVGEAFETEGFKAVWVDTYGNETDISNEITFDVNGTKIYDGYKFTVAGSKTVNCSYQGEKRNSFKISVISKDAKYLADGDYYIKILDKYVSMVGSRYLELSDKKPDEPFTVKQMFVDEDGYYIYKIMFDGGYVYQPSSKNGDQLMVSTSSGAPHQWRIAQYSNFCTIRDAGKQKLLVNASGQSSKNGTPVTVWEYSGSAPDHAKLSFIKADTK